ncbi:MAG: hypothetical protein HUJ57_08975, partial [Erysipelotrichaceae bacterium]|nr:hypothetical protein [Erysipelotrichaceae bacterium]
LAGIVMFVILTGIYYFVKFPTRTDDLYFYIPHVLKLMKETNASAALYDQYSFQIIYNFVAMMGKFAYSVFPMGDMLQEGFIVWYPAIILYWILSFSIVEVAVWLKNKRKHYGRLWIVAAIIFVYTIGAYWYLQTPYIGNSFRRVTILIQFILLMELSDRNDWKKVIVLALSFFSLVAQTSTGFIFAAIMLYAYVFYNAYRDNRGYLRNTAVMALGPVMFITRYMPQFHNPFVWVYVIFAMVCFLDVDSVLEQLLNKVWLPLLIAVPVLMGLFTRSPLFTPKSFNMSYFEVTPYFFDPHEYEGIENLFEFKFGTVPQIITSIFCVFCWICIVYYLVKNIRKKDRNYLSFHIIVVFLTFFNPWVITFVMTFITDAVYFRIYDMFFNILTIMAIWAYIADRLEWKKSLVFLCVMAICFINEVPKNQTWMFMGFDDPDYNPLYHVDNLELNVLKSFKSIVKSNSVEEPVVVMSQIYSSQAFTDLDLVNTKNNLITAPADDMSDEALYQRLSYRYEPGLPEADRTNSNHYCRLLQDRDVKYAIVEAQYNWDMQDGLGYCAQQIHEEGTYRIFEMHYEWLEWSKPLGD